jgi:hypothetical protein
MSLRGLESRFIDGRISMIDRQIRLIGANVRWIGGQITWLPTVYFLDTKANRYAVLLRRRIFRLWLCGL